MRVNKRDVGAIFQQEWWDGIEESQKTDVGEEGDAHGELRLQENPNILPQTKVSVGFR